MAMMSGAWDIDSEDYPKSETRVGGVGEAGVQLQKGEHCSANTW